MTQGHNQEALRLQQLQCENLKSQNFQILRALCVLTGSCAVTSLFPVLLKLSTVLDDRFIALYMKHNCHICISLKVNKFYNFSNLKIPSTQPISH